MDLVQYSLLTRRVNRMARAIPIGRPWDAKGAERLDSSSVMAWLEEEGAPNNSTARGLMAATAQSVFCADASQISMLLFLTVVAEEGGVEVLLEEAQTQRVVQGNGTLSRRLAASLAERGVEIRLGAEVVECSHSATDGATVATRDGARFRAQRVVLAVPPPALAGLSLEPKAPNVTRRRRIFFHLCFLALVIVERQAVEEREKERDCSLDRPCAHLGGRHATSLACIHPFHPFLMIRSQGEVRSRKHE